MKIMNLVFGAVLAVGLVGFLGCSKGNQGPGPTDAMEVEGVKVDLPKLIMSLESATPELQATARNVQMGFRYRQYEKSLMEIDKLVNDPGLTEQQKKIANEVLEQVKQVVAKAPAPAQ